MLMSFLRAAGVVALASAITASPALAYPGVLALGGWAAGFSHPLQGWDHFVVMVAVGLWAAQHAGRGRWMIPATFVGVMAIGGAIGASGLNMPGVEAMILVSVVILAGLALLRARMPLRLGMAVAALFAFFHGFAHGQEIPDTTHLATFGLGFMGATALLHGLGYGVGRLGALLAARRVHADL